MNFSNKNYARIKIVIIVLISGIERLMLNAQRRTQVAATAWGLLLIAYSYVKRMLP